MQPPRRQQLWAIDKQRGAERLAPLKLIEDERLSKRQSDPFNSTRSQSSALTTTTSPTCTTTSPGAGCLEPDRSPRLPDQPRDSVLGILHFLDWILGIVLRQLFLAEARRIHFELFIVAHGGEQPTARTECE